MELRDIISVLEHMLLLLELKNENAFKIRALEQGLRFLAREELDTDKFIGDLEAKRVKGFGPELTGYVLTLYRTGSLPYYEELRSEFPDGLFELFTIPGLGPKKIRTLYQELGIASLEELKAACESRKVSSLKGFGVKTEASIAEGIARQEQNRGKLLLHRARALAAELCSFLQASDFAVEVSPTGTIRRGRVVIDCIELLAATDAPDKLRAHLLSHALIGDDASLDGECLSVKLAEGTECRLLTCSPDQFGPQLWQTTGSTEHLDSVKQAAKTAGKKLPAGNEHELYHSLALSWIPPELREGMGEVGQAREAFQRGEGGLTLVQAHDLRGVLHAHTTYSDGVVSLAELARTVRDRGYEYLGVTDHSRSAGYAGGLSVDRVKAQHEEIEQLNDTLAPFVIFKGIESDILKDGSLDYPDDVLALFDFVVASVHSRHGLSEELMTERLVRALKNPFTTILGHPSGRLLLRRDAYAVQMDKVLDTAIEHGVAVEINSNPRRLDLDWRSIRPIRDSGILFPVNPDAHSLAELEYMNVGIVMAQKAGLSAEQVLNTMSAGSVRSYFARRRKERGV